VEDANFGEDVEVDELEWFLAIAERVALGRLREVLATRVFIEYFETSSC
jgi:hypothetical protein